MTERRNASLVKKDTKLPQHQNRHIDGHDAFDTSANHARRMSIKNSTGNDPRDEDEEFQNNLKDFSSDDY